MELEKLLLSPHPERIETARKLGITAVVLPEFDALFAHSSEEAAYPDAGNHTIAILQEAEEDKVIRFSALMIYLDPSAADRVMKRLKFDKAFLAAKIAQIDTLQLITVVPFREVIELIAIAYAITGFVVGVFGSLLSIRKFLNV